jgi:SpoIID/LytB domain protein
MTTTIPRLRAVGARLLRFLLVCALASAVPIGGTPEAHAASTFAIAGKGWGHGIGLSQWGARGFAEVAGYDHEQILGHYYQGTTLAVTRPRTLTVNLDAARGNRASWILRAGVAGRRLVVNGATAPADSSYRFTASGSSVEVRDAATGSLWRTFGGPVRVAQNGPLVEYSEETNPLLSYSSGWTRGAASVHSGGGYAHASTAGATMTVRFRGTSIAWVGPKAPSYGRAEVILDGTSRGTVSQYASSVSNQQTVWSISGLPEGEHTLVIRATGTKDAASTGSAIVADALDIRGAAASVRDVSLLQIVNTSGPFDRTYVRYRGVFRIQPESGRVRLLNELDAESYLYGVVPREMPSSWHMEALKAQAVAARSYAYTETRSELYCTVYSQVYHGHSIGSDRSRPTMHEAARSNSAVNSTWRQVARYGPSIVRAFYFASSGGHTANVEDVWGGSPQPYLTGVPDPYETRVSPATGAPWANSWGSPVSYSGSALATALRLSSPVTAAVPSIAKSGHVRSVAITMANGTKTQLNGDTFRSRLRMRSTMFTINGSGVPSVPGYDTYATFEQNDGRIAYGGSWVTGTGSLHSGGSYAYSTKAGSTLTVKFRGTSIAWIGPKAPSYGRAEVFVDGKSRGVVSQYASKVSYQQTVWSMSGLSDADHTLVIRVTGTKDSASTGTVVVADALRVGSAMPPLTLPDLVDSARFQESDKRLGYAGRWVSDTGTAHSGGGYRYSSAMGSTVKATFRGTSISWIGPKASSYGQAEIWLNGVKQPMVSQYTPSTSAQQVVWSVSGLPEGEHTIVIRVAGTREAASSGNLIVVDAFDVANENLPDLSGTGLPFTGQAEETDPAIRYVGTWHSGTNPAHSGNGYRYARDPDTYAIIEFTGTAIYWIGPKHASYGTADVYLDGVKRGTVSQYAPSTTFQQKVWSATGLSSGTHTLVIRATGTKEAASSGNTIVLDAFATERPMALATFQESAPEVREAGRWIRGTSAAYSGGGYTYSNTAGSTLRMSFTGTSIEWIGPKAASYGQAEVWLDGVRQATLSQYSPATAIDQTIWQVSGLEDRMHTLTIRALGTKEAASAGTVIVVDALRATTPSPPDAIAILEESSAGVTRSGTWVLASNSMFSGRGYAYSRTLGSRMLGRFSGEAVTIIGPKGPGYGRFDVYVDGVRRGTASQYSPSVLYQQPLYTVTGLTPGQHTVEVRVLNTKDSASAGTTVIIDAFDAARQR